MASRHSHRHGAQARSQAQPYSTAARPRHSQPPQPAHPSASQPPLLSFDGQPLGAGTSSAPLPTAASNAPRTLHPAGGHAKTKRGQRGTRTGGKGGDDGDGVEDEEAEEEEAYDPRQPRPIETDAHRLDQRQKQIDMGYRTPEYQAYTAKVPRHARKYEERFGTHPVTPNKHYACSKRSWDGQVRKWRRLLHQYDEPAVAAAAQSTAAAPMTDTADAMAVAAEQPTDEQKVASISVPSAHSQQMAAFFPLLPTVAAAAPTVKTEPATQFAPSHYAAAAPTSAFPSPSAALPPASLPHLPAAPSASSAPGSTAAGFFVPIAANQTGSALAVAADDRLASFEDEDLALLPESTSTTGTASIPGASVVGATIDDEELVDYDDDELELQRAIAAAAAGM